MAKHYRVAIAVRSLQLGGMERAAVNLAETFAGQGHETHLIYFRERNKALMPHEGVNVHRFDLEKQMKRSPFGLAAYLGAKLFNIFFRKGYFFPLGRYLSPKFERKIRALEAECGGTFDLIILRGQATFEMLWAIKDPRLIIQQVNISILRDIPFQHYYHRCLFNGKNIVSNARSVHDNLLEVNAITHTEPASMHVIPSPINIERIRERAKAYTPDIDTPFIVNIGRIVPVKNLTLLVDAFAYARTHLGLVHKLVIIGDGSERPAVEAQIRTLGLEQSIILTGTLKNPYPWLQKTDLMVFTSKHEGLPNVLLESLACHTPIVATSGEGGTVDIMQGDLAKNLVGFDMKAVAQKIVETLHSDQTIDYEKYLRAYTPQQVIQKYIDLYLCNQNT